MALHTLKTGDVAKVDRVFEWLIGLMTRFTLAIRQAAQVDRMLKGAGFGILSRRTRRVVDDGVTNVAVVRNGLA